MGGATVVPDDHDAVARSTLAQARCLDPAALVGASPLAVGDRRVGVVIDDLLQPHVAVRVARYLAGARYRRSRAGGEPGARPGDPDVAGPDPYRLGFLELDPPAGFDLDRLWLDEVFRSFTAGQFRERMGRLVGTDAGRSIDLGGHELRPGDAVGWHDDALRGQRLGIVYFATDAPVLGGQLSIRAAAVEGEPVQVEPVANRLVAFDARLPHEVREVVAGVRRTIVGRTWG